MKQDLSSRGTSGTTPVTAPTTGKAQEGGLCPRLRPRDAPASRPLSLCRDSCGAGGAPNTPPRAPQVSGDRVGPREQRHGGEQHAGPSRLQGRALSGCLPIWKQYCSNVRRPEYGIFSEYVNSTVRNMDLMDNLTGSQKSPDSSLGLHPALGSTTAQPSPARGQQRLWPWPPETELTHDLSSLFSPIGWERRRGGGGRGTETRSRSNMGSCP